MEEEKLELSKREIFYLAIESWLTSQKITKGEKGPSFEDCLGMIEKMIEGANKVWMSKQKKDL
jgi:hypothetical protein